MSIANPPSADWPVTTPWVDAPNLESLLAKSSLDAATQEQVRSFARDGYLIFDPQIPDFDRVSRELLDALQPHYGADGRLADAFYIHEMVRKIAAAPHVLTTLRTLYRREPFPFQTLNFCRGTEQATHSDAVFFHSMPAGFMCGVWVAFEDIHERNGPLHYFPGSQRTPFRSPQDLGLPPTAQGMSAYPERVRALMEAHGFKRVDLSLKRGQAIIWAANLYHGGSPILDRTSSRHSQVTHYFFNDCAYYKPDRSDPAQGHIRYIPAMNTVTGELIEQTTLGVPIRMGLRARARVLAEHRLHRYLVERERRRRAREEKRA